MAIISLRQTVKNQKLILHSATLKGNRDLHSTVNWCETNDSSLPYIISRLSEIIVYYDEAKMSSDEAVKVLLDAVDEDLRKKRDKLLNHLAITETNLRLVRAKLAKVSGGAV